ncbi:PP2C family protein-serine/threonine phosphatase [Microcoleus sp. S13C4]|uniref:PP2C family protein-serine/threonine phosphatase n=1 Tax=Microcoleus sp. S13C4 TaxID=3055410 RepID=UPI004040AB30
MESGVLMIMVPTAVRTLIAYNEPDPVRFLSAINSVIYNNVQRMKCDKNASLALLDYEEGMLKLSGQHEEMIVVRCNGCAERFDTIHLGFPIGLDVDIAEFVAEKIVYLRSGDVVVLYTDGITEAENMEKLLYGLDRLIKVIEINWQRSAAETRHAVIKDVRSHIGEQKVFDDITLLVRKQK